jgi:hypothetical protein
MPYNDSERHSNNLHAIITYNIKKDDNNLIVNSESKRHGRIRKIRVFNVYIP